MSSRVTNKAGLLLFLALVVILLLIPTWRAWRERQDILEMPAGERRGLFDRTMANYRASCTLADRTRLPRYCEQQADFLAGFPECNEECRRLISAETPSPSR